MVYKMIKEWKSDERNAHEITIYKYNYTCDEMVRYSKEGFELMIQTFVAGGKIYEELWDLRDGEKKWWNYNQNTLVNK